MQKDVKFQLEEAVEIPNWCDAYPEHKFCVYKCCILSTAKNAHGLDIDEETLRKFAPTILGNFLTAKVENGDARGHEKDEETLGYFPIQQEIEFVKDENGIVKAYCFAVVSKRYGKKLNDIFEYDNLRNSSVEMTVQVEGDAETGKVESFDIYSLTVLNKSLDGSCPDADIKMVRFSKEDAEAYFAKNDSLSALKSFAEERKQAMAEKKYVSHPINTSKDDIYTGEWDGNKAKQDLIEEKNYKSLAPKVCLKLEEGWEDREVTKLGYPVMGLYDGEWRYSTRAIASAQAYAEQNDETEVLNKIKDIRKKLDLDDTDGKEEKMSMEIEFAAVDIGDMWGRLYRIMGEERRWEYGIVGIYEEDNQKFAIICDRDQKLYRLDFSLTEDGMTVADEVVEVKQEFTETDNIKKFAEPENVADYRFAEQDDDDDKDDDDDDKTKMSEDEMIAKIAQLEKDIEERDNIIMEKDTELADLRKFKDDIEAKEKAMAVEKILSDYKDYMTEEQCEDFRKTGLECQMSEIDGWANKVKAVSFDALVASKKSKDNKSDVWRFSAPAQKNTKEIKSVWDKF